MIVLDAGVLIAFLEIDDAFHAGATGLIETRGRDGLSLSAMTLAECLVHPAARGSVAQSLSAIERLAIRTLPVLAEHAAALAETRAATGLRMPDAIVLHAAESTGAAMATTDRRLARAAEDRGVRVHLIPPD